MCTSCRQTKDGRWKIDSVGKHIPSSMGAGRRPTYYEPHREAWTITWRDEDLREALEHQQVQEEKSPMRCQRRRVEDRQCWQACYIQHELQKLWSIKRRPAWQLIQRIQRMMKKLGMHPSKAPKIIGKSRIQRNASQKIQRRMSTPLHVERC